MELWHDKEGEGCAESRSLRRRMLHWSCDSYLAVHFDEVIVEKRIHGRRS